MGEAWISVKDQLPVDRQQVLVYDPSYDWPVYEAKYEDYLEDISGYRNQWWMGAYGRNTQFEDGKITHWMPMPSFKSPTSDMIEFIINIIKNQSPEEASKEIGKCMVCLGHAMKSNLMVEVEGMGKVTVEIFKEETEGENFDLDNTVSPAYNRGNAVA